MRVHHIHLPLAIESKCNENDMLDVGFIIYMHAALLSPQLG